MIKEGRTSSLVKLKGAVHNKEIKSKPFNRKHLLRLNEMFNTST